MHISLVVGCALAVVAGCSRSSAGPDAGADRPEDALLFDAAGHDGGGEVDASADGGVPGTVTPQSCGQVIDVDALFAERVGWGRTTTGGNPTNVYVVDTLAGGVSGTGNHGSLRRALESTQDYWIVFAVNGEILLSPEIANVRSNKTIDGRGRDVTINGQLRMNSVRNIIVTDVTLTNDAHLTECGQSGDVVVISGPGGANPGDYASRRFWFHHVNFTRGGDGLLDLRGATDVTVSWSHLNEHSKGMLMWKDSNGNASPGMRVTMHHNFVDQLTVRGPRFHYGSLHYFNNYVFHWYDHGVGCMDSAQCLFQGNVFESRTPCSPTQIFLGQCADPAPCGDEDGGTPNAAVVIDDGNTPGFTRSEGDLLLNGASIAQNQSSLVFSDPGYPFVVEPPATGLAQRLRNHTGPRTTLCNLP